MAYIDIDKARKHLRVDCLAKYPTTYIDGLLAAADELTRIPTADVAEVVFCKNCTHGHWEQETWRGKCVHYCDLTDLQISKEHFCSYGERKTT